ncbi:MAG: hypothetical protein EP338_11720 [Bacteroidetes bacterium]|nr:MAG: hypothetical protein EP338_11720 [Bacteroidota bacterium]
MRHQLNLLLRNSLPFQFFLFLLGLSLLMHWFEIIKLAPTGSHIWRQCDSLSIVQNYFYDGQALLSPRTNDYREAMRDVSLTEFPIIYYLDSWIWKLTGENFWSPRLLNLFFLIAGLWGLFKGMSLLKIRKPLLFAVLALVMASPVLSHYAVNVLPNTAAIGLTFLSWYFFYRYDQEGTKKHLLIAILLLSLSGLLKITLIFSFVIYLFILLYRWYQRKETPYFPLLLLFAGLGIIYLWTHYLNGYNHESAAASLFESFSVFAHSSEEIKAVWNGGFKDHWILIEHRVFWFGFCILFLFNFYQIIRHRNWLVLWIHLLLMGSSTIYFLVFFMSFENHDYYLLDLIPHITVHLITTAYYLSRLSTKWPVLLFQLFAYTSVVIGSGHVVARNLDIQKGMAKLQSHLVDRYSFGFHQYFRYDSSLRWPLKQYRKQLRQLGINRQTAVICVPDQSPNISLYYFNLRGQSNFHLPLMEPTQELSQKAREGYQFLILQKNLDQGLEERLKTIDFYKIWEDQLITVYRITTLATPKK